MNSQHHFIIKYDTATKSWEWDTESEQVRFGKAIYLPEEDSWVSSSESKDINDIDNDLSEKLGKAIYLLNEYEENN